MAFCSLQGLPGDAAGCELAFWVSPSSTPTSVCQSSTTEAPAIDTPPARHCFHSSPPPLAAHPHLQLRQLCQQHEQHLSCQLRAAQPQPQTGPLQKVVWPASDSKFVQSRVPRLHQQPQSVPAWAPAGTCSASLPLPTAPSCSPDFLPGQENSLLRSLLNRPLHWQQLQPHLQAHQDALPTFLRGRWPSESARGGGVGNGGGACASLVAERRHGMKRVAEHCPYDEPQVFRRQRSSVTAAPACSSCSTRPLQRHDSLDSDVTNAAASSSFRFAVPTAASGTTLTVLAVPAHAAIAAPAPTTRNRLVLAPPVGGPTGYLPGNCQGLDAPLLFASCTLTQGSVGYKIGSLFSTSSLCKGEEFILYAAGALQLLPDSSTHLALHLWRRISGMVRLVLSIRHPAAGKDDPGVTVCTYRIHATSCLWLAAKLEAQRRLVVEAKVLAALAQTSPRVLCATELRLLGWLEWCPLRGYLPPAPPP